MREAPGRPQQSLVGGEEDEDDSLDSQVRSFKDEDGEEEPLETKPGPRSSAARALVLLTWYFSSPPSCLACL